MGDVAGVPVDELVTGEDVGDPVGVPVVPVSSSEDFVCRKQEIGRQEGENR